MHHRTPALILAVLLLLLHSVSVNAGRPLTIDDAATVPPGQLEFEAGFYHGLPSGVGRDQKWPVAAFTLGVIDRLEIGIAIQRVNQDGPGTAPTKGFEDLHLNAKYKFVDENAPMPALAAALDVKLPTANRSNGLSTGKTDESLLLIATKTFAAFAIHANLGYTIAGKTAGADLKNQVRGGMAMEWALNRSWSLVGEATVASRTAKAEPNQADFQLGFRYALRPSLVFDIAAGRSLRPVGTTAQGTFGLTWTTDLNKIFNR